MSAFGKCLGGGRRSAARMAVPLTAVVTTLTESRSAIVMDVSASGARVRGSSLPKAGQGLFLAVDGIVVFGAVAWEEDDERGIAFDTPLRAIDAVSLKQRMMLARGLPPEVRAAFEDWSLGLAR